MQLSWKEGGGRRNFADHIEKVKRKDFEGETALCWGNKPDKAFVN